MNEAMFLGADMTEAPINETAHDLQSEYKKKLEDKITEEKRKF